MKQTPLLLAAWLLAQSLPGATITVGTWSPIFKGSDLASGSQVPQVGGEALQQVLCMRVDLTDPDIVLFTTPHCASCGLETLSENTSYFLEEYGLQAAVNGAFFASSTGPADTPLGTPDDVYGLAISMGSVVSPANMPLYSAAFLFGTNNQAIYIPTNSPGTNTSGIYTAISGSRTLLIRGTNINAATPNDLDPRTAMGLSQDRRYLYLLTIDGRQPGWSEGADFRDTGEWLKRFGASDGINVDGGGSTTMVKADCVGKSVLLNKPSFVAAYGRERVIGHNFGVYARPALTGLNNFNIEPGTTTAIMTWGTETPMTTQVLFGSTTNLGSATSLDSRLTRKHVATLAGLSPGANYFFKAVSTAGSLAVTQACQFSTLSGGLVATPIFGLTNVWRYQTNNLNGTGWTAPGYNDAGWLGQGPGLLYVANANNIAPKSTVLPPPYGQNIPTTYYFRTHFTAPNPAAGTTLTFSNYVDDGAVFYLNGAEVQRLRMPAAPTAILNSTLATGYACSNLVNQGDAGTNCPDVFTLSGSAVSNLVAGDNVVAVEVHNYATGSKDVVFGSALALNAPVSTQPTLQFWLEDNWVTFFWNGEGFTLQQASTLGSVGNWTDVPGPVTHSPYTTTNGGTKFYRLRR